MMDVRDGLVGRMDVGGGMLVFLLLMRRCILVVWFPSRVCERPGWQWNLRYLITCRYDVNGSTLNPLSHGLGVLAAILRKLVYKRPLLYFLSAGALFLAAGSLSVFSGIILHTITKILKEIQKQ